VAFWQALYAYGTDIVLAGHQHNYERFAPQSPDGRADPSTGIRQFVVGTGGKSLYTFSSPPAPNSEVRSSDAFGVLELTLHPRSYEWRFLPAAGEAFSDAGEDQCVGQPPTSVSLRAKPRRVAPGHRTHLRAAVSPCPGDEGIVRFQRRSRRGWRTLATVPTDHRCVAAVTPRISRTTRFVAVALRDRGASSARSHQMKVRAKRR
jgi:hypothetical protein